MNQKTKDGIINLVLILIVFGVNFYLVRPFFRGEYTRYLQSIEVNFFTIAQLFKSLGRGWNPFWYLGTPLYTHYTPLLPAVEILLSKFTAVSLARAYRLLAAVSFCLVPVSLYVFVLTLGKKKLPALFAALAFSLLPSINYLLVPEVREVASGFSMSPWRLIVLAFYGEGPHTAAQVFALLAGTAYWRLLEKGTFKWMVVTSVLVAMTGLTNAVGFFALVILLLVLGFVGIFLDSSREQRLSKWRVSWQTAVLSYGFLAFWYHPAFVRDSLSEGEGIIQNYLALFPWGLVLVLGFLAVVYVALSRLKCPFGQVGLLWLLVGLFLVLAHYYLGVDYAPQALRYMVEVDMAAAMMIGFLFIVGEGRAKRLLMVLMGTLSILGLLVFSRTFWAGGVPFSWEMTRPGKNIKEAAEYEIAHQLSECVEGGERVYTSGSYAFWLNHFVDVPQVRGSFDQANIHPWALHASYQILKGESGRISLDWAKIMNVGCLMVSTDSSRNKFKDFAYPGKFEGVLEEIYRDKGDIIYRIPLKDNSLAKAVDKERVLVLDSPRNAVDEEPIDAYVDWLEEGRGLEIKKLKNGYQIKGSVSEEEVVLVQISYHSGWKAKADGQELETRSDPLGFLIVDVPEKGSVVVTLEYQRIPWQYVGCVVTLMTLGYVLYGLITGVNGGEKDSLLN